MSFIKCKKSAIYAFVTKMTRDKSDICDIHFVIL